MQELLLVLPSRSLYFPREQSVQNVAPEVPWYVPPGQSIQSDPEALPTAWEYLLAAQWIQLAETQFPAGQRSEGLLH